MIAKSWGTANVDFEEGRARAGVEEGHLWVRELHYATLSEASALIECIQAAIKYKTEQRKGSGNLH